VHAQGARDVPICILSGETAQVLHTRNRWWLDAWDHVSDGGWDSRRTGLLVPVKEWQRRPRPDRAQVMLRLSIEDFSGRALKTSRAT